MDKLSDGMTDGQKKKKVEKLLTFFRLKGKIVNMGSDANPNWVLVEKIGES